VKLILATDIYTWSHPEDINEVERHELPVKSWVGSEWYHVCSIIDLSACLSSLVASV